MNTFKKLFCVVGLLGVLMLSAAAQKAPTEADYYTIQTYELPSGVVLEVGGILHHSDGRLYVATRRGEIYIVENGLEDPSKATFKQFTFGLSQPLGLLEKDGWIYCTQRGELTRLKDTNNDDKADVFETVCDMWEISGNYHEYAFGPRLDKDGYMWVTLNKPFGGEPYGRAHWRGWAVKVDPKTGKMLPVATGLRSPAGIEVSPWGEAFYTDNQGEWCNASKLSHIGQGEFHGHPHGLPTTKLPESPIKYPGEPKSGTLMKDMHLQIPSFKMPAVWFPYNRMGKSPSGLVWDQSGGKFGPFKGQLFVGDQTFANVMRVHLEKVDGHWQGACFPFREGFQCGITRVTMARDGSMIVGMTNRGWGGRGNAPYGLQRLVWNKKVPFEIHTMSAASKGFKLTFTKPVDRESAGKIDHYKMKSYTYRLRSNYGGPDENTQENAITKVDVAEDGKSVVLTVDNLRKGYVHELNISDQLKNQDGHPLLHRDAYYTLVNIPSAAN